MRRLGPLSFVLALTLWGCPSTDVICRTGTSRCGVGCADFSSDTRNCGACGVACQATEVCQASACACQPGTERCNGTCVVLETDPRNCGACGNACAAGQVCEQRQCKAGCSLGGASRCGDSCVDLQHDPRNCGACGRACEAPQSCHSGRCSFDVVAACFGSGQVVGLERDTATRGPLEPLGTAPAALATYGDVLLAADGLDRTLLQAELAARNGHAFGRVGPVTPIGTAANFVLADPPWVYVVNSGANTLQVLRTDGGTPDGGVVLTTVAELPFGANTIPEVAVKSGTSLWVPLYGGTGAAAAAQGQKVVQVDVSNPAQPVVANTVELANLDLKAFDGGRPGVARPMAAVMHLGALHVALNNLNPDTYAPEGPGLVAKVNVDTRAVEVIDLGGADCLNPVAVASHQDVLLASCAGRPVYDMNNAVVSNERAGVVAVRADGQRSVWKAECVVAADAGCSRPLPGRLAALQDRVWVSDQNGGRLFVLDLDGGVLSERRGFNVPQGPVAACAVDPITGIGNVSDVLLVP